MPLWTLLICNSHGHKRTPKRFRAVSQKGCAARKRRTTARNLRQTGRGCNAICFTAALMEDYPRKPPNILLNSNNGYWIPKIFLKPKNTTPLFPTHTIPHTYPQNGNYRTENAARSISLKCRLIFYGPSSRRPAPSLSPPAATRHPAILYDTPLSTNHRGRGARSPEVEHVRPSTRS